MIERRKKTKASTENTYEILIQSVIDYAIYMLDINGRVTNWNAGAERIKGYTSTEIIGQHFSRFYTPEDVEIGVPYAALATAQREGRYEAEGWRCRKDGSRFWAMVVIDAIHQDGKLIGFAKITRDLTERRNTQIALEQSREQLFQLQKMEAVGQLSGGLAHDFNNLLTGITGSLELLQTRLDQGRFLGMERYIDIALGAAKRAGALTHRLLAFSRRQTLDPKPTSITTLVVGMEELIRRTAGPAITVCMVMASDNCTTVCDPNQLENALLNLCINARDAMPDGGKLTVETGWDYIDEKAASACGIIAGCYVFISVTDNGIGMAPDIVARAFDPFFTTKPMGQGTGLGLSMIHGFARQSGGDARLSSAVGIGTTARIYLPKHPSHMTEGNVPVDLTKPKQTDDYKTVLIIDDEPTIRTLVAEILEELGYKILTASDGPQGLQLLHANPPIKLLITDVGLPGMNGRQVADAARVARPELKILFITGYAENALVGNGVLEPGMHVLTKPFALDVLTERVKTIIADI